MQDGLGFHRYRRARPFGTGLKLTWLAYKPLRAYFVNLMPSKKVSQRTLVAVMRALREYGSASDELEEPPNLVEFLYEHDLPDWFITHARSSYSFEWREIIPAIRNTQFFFPHTYFGGPGANVAGIPYLSPEHAATLGEELLHRLAAVAASLPNGEAVTRSLELDGFRVNMEKLTLVRADSVVSEQQEEDRVAVLVGQSGLPSQAVILKHIGDAHELFVQGKDHASIGESRNLIQALIDNISATTNASGGHSAGYPGGMTNRLKYLEDVGFFTADEKTAFGAAWGFLSAGSHPGIPSRDEARIGLILSLEFGLLLLLKFANWTANGFRRFS